MKFFNEALKDSFIHVKEITDPETLHKFRNEGYRVDEEGYWYQIIDSINQIERRIYPILDEGMYCEVLYKRNIPISTSLPIRSLEESDI